jgi:hypothetical protein
LLERSERTAELTLPPRPDRGDVWNETAGHFYDGYDSLRLQNYTMFPELGPQTIWAFRDPAQLRSRFAAFDPAKRESSDFMAGFAAPGAGARSRARRLAAARTRAARHDPSSDGPDRRRSGDPEPPPFAGKAGLLMNVCRTAVRSNRSANVVRRAGACR